MYFLYPHLTYSSAGIDAPSVDLSPTSYKWVPIWSWPLHRKYWQTVKKKKKSANKTIIKKKKTLIIITAQFQKIKYVHKLLTKYSHHLNGCRCKILLLYCCAFGLMTYSFNNGPKELFVLLYFWKKCIWRNGVCYLLYVTYPVLFSHCKGKQGTMNQYDFNILSLYEIVFGRV